MKTSQISVRTLLAVSFLASCLVSGVAEATRLKDIATISGIRSNQLIGYGLVVGLTGTGDQTTQAPFTVQSLNNMLKRLGVSLPDNANPQLKNVAAVSLQAELPPFAKPGQTIDVTVSSIGNAISLRGGSLVLSPLKGADGKVYAVAQGNMVVGGFGAQGADGSKVTVNIPSSGRIPNGATVERAVPNSFADASMIQINLNEADFTTAQRVTASINDLLGPGMAAPIDSVSIQVTAPKSLKHKVSLIAELETIQVQPGEPAARIIINSRTGTVVIGSNVRMLPAAVTHGSLTVSIAEAPRASQPQPFARGRTAVLPDSDLSLIEEKNPMFLFNPGVTLDELVQAVNRVGAAPGDLVAILEALERVGSLQAELVVI